MGDALLGAFVSRFLYETLPPETREDALSRARVAVVRRETLAQAAREMGVSELLAVGPGERKERREANDSLLADAYEALVAAVFLENGSAAMEKFVTATLGRSLSAVAARPPEPDPKTLLQMRLQALGRGTPTYRTVEESSDGRRHEFSSEALAADGAVIGAGKGSNRRAAETEAAREAIAKLAK